MPARWQPCALPVRAAGPKISHLQVLPLLTPPSPRPPNLQGRDDGARGAGPADAPSRAAVTLADAEREHILGVLREAGWVLGGANGAAARLAMKRTTLQSKMKKLGIARPT